MSQSLYTAMGGISAAQTELNVISNNIANINTTGYKSSAINFSDVYYGTISSGTGASGTTGGTNPIQVGIGVQVSAVSKNFNSGTWIATGASTDLMIQGSGFFTAQSPAGEVFYTRAGNFSFDSAGDLVTTDGYKIIGTDKVLATTSAVTPTHIPQLIVTNVTPNASFTTNDITSLNNCSMTDGKFNLSVNNNATPLEITIDTATNTTMAMLRADIQRQLNDAASPATAAAAVAAAAALPGVTPAEITAKTIATAEAAAAVAAAAAAAAAVPAFSYGNVTVTCDLTTNGTMQFSVAAPATSLTFSNSAINQSNFLAQTGLATATIAANTYTSNVLDYKVDVSQVTSVSAATKINSYSIGGDGSIQATYANGDSLAVKVGADGNTYQFTYTTAENIVINGTNVNVDSNVAVPANFVVQLASITNPDGLLARGSNLFSAGANSGNIVYSVGNAMGLGNIASGGLESSNVDLSTEFSNMIMSQRAVQANSRVFTTTSNIMDTIVAMGR